MKKMAFQITMVLTAAVLLTGTPFTSTSSQAARSQQAPDEPTPACIECKGKKMVPGTCQYGQAQYADSESVIGTHNSTSQTCDSDKVTWQDNYSGAKTDSCKSFEPGSVNCESYLVPCNAPPEEVPAPSSHEGATRIY